MLYSLAVYPQAGTSRRSVQRRPAGFPAPSMRSRLGPLLLTCLVAGGVLAFFLAVYPLKHYPMPIGYDTPRYLFQTHLAGLLGLAHVPSTLPPPIKSLSTRTGFPVTVLSFAGLFRTSTFAAASVVPAAAATALALAAAAFVTVALRRGAVDLAVLVAVVGTSSVLVRLMAPETYTDNLLAGAVFMAALVPMVSAVRGGKGTLGAAVLLGLGGVIHPQFLMVFLAILAAVAALYLPASWRAWRRDGSSVWTTPSARIGAAVAGGGAVAAATFVGLIGNAPVEPKQTRFEIRKKFRLDVPLYRYPVSVPAALVGTAAVAGSARGSGPAGGGERQGARFLLALSVAWGVVTVAGVLALAAGTGTAAHRLLSFLLPLPLLIGLAFLALGGMVGRLTGRWIGVAVVVLGVAAVAVSGAHDLYVALPRARGPLTVLDIGKVQEAATAAAYLDRMAVPDGAPVVFVIDDRGPNPLSWVPEMTYMIRSVLPPERVPHVFIYVGDPGNYLEGRPTYRDSPNQYDANERRFWPTIQRLLPRRPVALLLSAYNPAYGAFVGTHPESVIAPEVALLAGPRPPAPLPSAPYPSGPRRLVHGGALGIGTLVVLGLLGLGWAALLPVGVRPFERLALAPALGIGALVMAGVVVDAAGIRLTGGGAVAPFVVAAVPGWAAAGWRRAANPTRSLRRRTGRPGRTPWDEGNPGPASGTARRRPDLGPGGAGGGGRGAPRAGLLPGHLPGEGLHRPHGLGHLEVPVANDAGPGHRDLAPEGRGPPPPARGPGAPGVRGDGLRPVLDHRRPALPDRRRPPAGGRRGRRPGRRGLRDERPAQGHLGLRGGGPGGRDLGVHGPPDGAGDLPGQPAGGRGDPGRGRCPGPVRGRRAGGPAGRPAAGRRGDRPLGVLPLRGRRPAAHGGPVPARVAPRVAAGGRPHVAHAQRPAGRSGGRRGCGGRRGPVRCPRRGPGRAAPVALGVRRQARPRRPEVPVPGRAPWSRRSGWSSWPSGPGWRGPSRGGRAPGSPWRSCCPGARRPWPATWGSGSCTSACPPTDSWPSPWPSPCWPASAWFGSASGWAGSAAVSGLLWWCLRWPARRCSPINSGSG